ncbi:MAG: type I-E CRISPR-associated protein Cas5/CasD [Actinomycetota bacterium]|nr:type I-E CRISPR-associated protein Cas5/CasD [Actinomycetota bacterium]
MSVLALRLGGPLQAWGSSQRLDTYRRTERFPTKSAVIGLVAAALGRRRSDAIDDLAALRFGVRVDRPGEVLRDFHIVSSLFDDKGRFAPGEGRLPTASGNYRSVEKSTKVTERDYVADACFVAGLEGDQDVLDDLDEAVGQPVFPLFLGRRSCPPDAPVRLGVHGESLLQVFAELPWEGGAAAHRAPAFIRCEVILEDAEGPREVVDSVRTFDPVLRSYDRRRVRHEYLDVPNPISTVSRVAQTHDPMALLDEA